MNNVTDKLDKLVEFFGFHPRWSWEEGAAFDPLPTTMDEWLASRQFKASGACASIPALGKMSEEVWKALSQSQTHGSVEAETDYGSVHDDTSALEGRRIETLMQDWFYRRADATVALKTYVKKGYEFSTKVFHTLTCLHPNLAFGFHCLSRLRIGAFLDLADVRQLAAHSYAVFSNTEKDVDNSAVDRCPCCKKPRMHDTAGHFIFVKKNK